MKHNLKPIPPRWAIRFFHWFCNDHLADAVMGDLTELYDRRAVRFGKKKADLLFVINVLLFVQPFAIKRKSNSTSLNHIAMFQSYFKMAWRTMNRQKMYASIKIGGFALGLATCMIIALYIRQELSYDQHYKNVNRIYRVYNDFTKESDAKWTSFPASMGPILKADYPEVEKSGRLIPYKWFDGGSSLIRRSDEAESIYEEGIAYADQELLEILEIPMIYGNPAKALTEPHSIIISKSKADKYFPNEDPVGKLVVLNDDPNKTFTVGGVFPDFPVNHHLQFDFFLTLKEVEFWPGEQASWCCWNYNVYVLLRLDANPPDFEKKMLAVKDVHYVGHLKETGNQSAADVAKYHTFKLQRVNEIYLNSLELGDNLSHGDRRYIWLFGAVALFILLLACINFINLSTAKSANRAKEVGLRKVVGSFRISLIRQFLTESILYSIISVVLAGIILLIALPSFNSLVGKSLSVPWDKIWLYPLLISFTLFIGFVAGIYPSFYLSSFSPIEVLKGSLSRGSKSSALRSTMVVFQFATSIILIIGTFVIYKQMNFILNAKVGFDKEQIVMIQGANTLNQEKQEVLKNELLKYAEIKNVTASNYLPVEGTNRDQNGFWKDGKSKEEKGIGAQAWRVDENYIPTLSIKLLEGRNFDRTIASDSDAVIINQAMVKELGLKNPLEEKIMNWRSWTVIGVVEDFNFESMKDKIGPLCFMRGKGGDVISVKVQSEDRSKSIAIVTNEWNKLMPHQPIRYTFMDESYARMYADVQRTGNILTAFALLAVFVACLGLFALSAFMVEQRNKEISIRLVLGASTQTIFRLLTQNFLMLVLISFVIATPIAGYLMNSWLQDFEYKIEITWDVYAVAAMLAILIALLTVSYQSLKAAFVNPISRLRSE